MPQSSHTLLQLLVRSMAGRVLLLLAALCGSAGALAQTYTNASTTFNWINPATHTKVGYNTAPYRFNACGTTPPVLDDNISDAIPIGFNFVYGVTSYNTLRIETNGRLQFNNSNCSAGTSSIGPPQRYTYTYPNGSMNNTMKAFGVDLDPTNLVDKPNYPSAANKTNCTSSATCYISYASIGTAPNRQFVVSWKSVPEWVNTTNTSGSFDVQIVLNEDGSFLYQYLNIVHGGTGSAQIGWQLTSTDYSVLTFGASVEPPPNTAILFYIPSANPLVDYRFEEGAWSPGTAGQVSDSSGNGRPGAALGLAQESSAGKVCRGAAIPGNNNAAAIDAIRTGVRLSDAGVNMAGQGAIMFWYQSSLAWSGAGAQAAQLVDATAVAGQWFSLTKTAVGTLFFELTDSTGVLRSVETPAQAVAAGTWVHVAISWNFNALPGANSDHMQVFVNAGVPTSTVFSSNGNINGTLGLVHVGDNPSGLTGTKGSVNSANGIVDELRFYNFELNQGQVLGASGATHGCPTFAIDHLELRHASWSGIACAPGTLTVVACSNAACSSLYTSGMIATLSSGGAATLWDPAGGGATIVIGSGQSSATRSFYTAAGSATFNVVGTGVPVLEANSKKCNGAAGSCDWTSANGGLVISVPASGVVLGGKPTALTLQAVQSSGPTPGSACVPVQNLAGAGLKLWSTALTPASFAASLLSAGVAVGGRPQVANALAGAYVATPAAVPGADNLSGLAFDANATTTVWLKHMDTGQFNLNVTLDVAASTTVPALSLSGSAPVTALPLGYAVTAASVTAAAATQAACAAGPSAACDASAGASARVGAAGDAFAATVSAALWTVDSDTDLGDNPVAPSYAGVVSLVPALAAPQGGSAGALGSSSAVLAAGLNTIAAQTWTQSGALRILASATYLAQPVAGQSALLGRFSPRNFTTVVASQGCGSFTYSGQPIASVSIRAMDGAAVPGVTPNYAGAFARQVSLSDGSGAGLGSLSANVVAAADFAAGSATSAPVYSLTVAKTAPQTISLRASDGEASSTGFTEGSAPIRSGRLRLQNAYGSELLALPLALDAQYWSGSFYSTNLADGCTVLPMASITMGNYQKQLNACETQISPVGSVTLVAGRLPGVGLVLSKPGAGNAGSVDLAINSGTTPSGNTCVSPAQSAASAGNMPWFGPNQGARATFGIYKSPIIYRRENF